MAINNAALLTHPNSFIALDHAKCFNYNIFANPNILKLVPEGVIDDVVQGQRVGAYPNTLCYELRKDATKRDFCSLTGPLVDWRNTFFIALHCLYQLGFRTINLVGCLFEQDKDNPYAYEHDLDKDALEHTERTYSSGLHLLEDLAPAIADEGVLLRTCHKDTPFDGIVDYVPFEVVVGEATRQASAIVQNKIVHCRSRE